MNAVAYLSISCQHTDSVADRIQSVMSVSFSRARSSSKADWSGAVASCVSK